MPTKTTDPITEVREARKAELRAAEAALREWDETPSEIPSPTFIRSRWFYADDTFTAADLAASEIEHAHSATQSQKGRRQLIREALARSVERATNALLPESITVGKAVAEALSTGLGFDAEALPLEPSEFEHVEGDRPRFVVTQLGNDAAAMGTAGAIKGKVTVSFVRATWHAALDARKVLRELERNGIRVPESNGSGSLSCVNGDRDEMTFVAILLPKASA